MDVDNNVKTVENNAEMTQAQGTENPIDYEALYRESARALTDLTAERDSLLSENNELRSARDAALADSAKIKEVNYTLSRQLNLQQDVKREPEKILADMFLKKGD